MPIYEYQCHKCGTIEVTQRITEKSLTKCPTCKSKVKRLISNTSFQLKGTGWYVTDYARKGQTNGDSKSDNGSKSSAESKSEATKSDNGSKSSSSESKSEATKSESKTNESKKSESSTSGSDKSSSTSSTAST